MMGRSLASHHASRNGASTIPDVVGGGNEPPPTHREDATDITGDNGDAIYIPPDTENDAIAAATHTLLSSDSSYSSGVSSK
jgi:hypothetical protein